MASNFLKKLFGDTSTKEIKKIMPLVEKIESLEAEYKALSDEALQAKTPWFKSRLAAGETLDDILPEAFATVVQSEDVPAYIPVADSARRAPVTAFKEVK